MTLTTSDYAAKKFVTIFAGIVSMARSRAVPEALAGQMRNNLSRFAGDRPELLGGDGFAISHLDLGLLPGTGKFVDASGAMTLLAGSLLFSERHVSRDDELRLLHEAVRRNDQALLRDACGTFCAVHYDPGTQRLWLIADSLGLRPLYYAVESGYVFFSTALRVLEAMELPTKRCDLRGQWQLASLTYTLGGATPYEGIRTLEAGEIVELHESGLRRFKYWCWQDLREKRVPEQVFLTELFRAFKEAIDRRSKYQTAAVSYLSGGLDSRCIVACLKLLRTDIHTINFSPSGSADSVLGALTAEKFETRHFQCETGSLDFWERMVSSHAAWLQQLPGADRPELPGLVWAGYGGETVLAPTNLSSEILTMLRCGRMEDAISAFLEKEGAGPAGKLILEPVRNIIGDAPREAIRDELKTGPCNDPARRLHELILSNNLRGQLARHHDDMDVRRLEFLMPFVDSRFLRVALSYPLEDLMEHRLYHRWLTQFPAATASVPWQSYPEHEPCPLPLPAGLRVQSEGWFDDAGQRAAVRQLVVIAKQDLASPRFPTSILNRRALWLALKLTELGFHRYTYLLNTARIFVRYAC